ncbi:hypothetical protein TeGR_g11502 [Tetraparma gracilis]|uniref:Uncharacterized protein n=1 Tax=Tetraparma gracilis TaxID=2962635 RepID=A0ABQ6MW01_9STRA|nr:hypothetical protein TeGR_g11502 [Tetraparma gracilis]
MPDYSDWARKISEGSEERRVGQLIYIRAQLDACEDDKDNENGPHALLVKETEFVAALVSLACDSSIFGDIVISVLFRLATLEMNRLPLRQFPGLLDALITTPHEDTALTTLSWLCDVKDEAQQVALATNTALVALLVANVGRFNGACVSLYYLCFTVDNNRALLYEHPGLIAAVADATRVPACAQAAVGVLNQMTLSDSLRMPMLRNPLVLDALFRAAGSDIDEVSNRPISCLYNLSLESENRALMRDDVRIMDALTARMDHEASKKALFIICYIGHLPSSLPTFDLSLFGSRSFHHQLSLVKALIREHPEQLSTPDASGHTPLTLAQAAPLPAHIIGLLSDCVATSTLPDFSLAHLVGYKRSQRALVLAQRRTLMCSLERIAVKEDSLGALRMAVKACRVGGFEDMLMRNLEHAADQLEQPVEEDTPGALNVRKAVRAYRVGGKDPWSIIACFAF